MTQKSMTKVKCTSCGKECEVPFKPTPGKPVYCRECFSERRSKPQVSRDKSSDFEPKQAWARRRRIGQTQSMDKRSHPLRKFSHTSQ